MQSQCDDHRQTVIHSVPPLIPKRLLDPHTKLFIFLTKHLEAAALSGRESLHERAFARGSHDASKYYALPSSLDHFGLSLNYDLS